MDDFISEEVHPHRIQPIDSWRILRIMSEFVEGFESMTALGPSVAIFGSSKAQPKSRKYYELAEKTCAKIAEKGYGIITGGGPGIMESANKGAQSAQGRSCGLCIDLTKERPNSYIDYNYEFNFRYFFVRKVMFVRYAMAFVVFPGGYGTLDELFEALTLIQTQKIRPFPVYLVGKEYWKGLLDWIKTTMLEKHGNISQDHFDLIRLSDDPDEIVEGIEAHYRHIKSLENF